MTLQLQRKHEIIWQQPQNFSGVIVRMGAFHISCAIVGALGRCLKSSEFGEILLEPEIYASGSIEKYFQEITSTEPSIVHKIVLGALECLLLMQFENSHDMEEEAQVVLLKVAKGPCKENLSEALASENCMRIHDLYTGLDKVRRGELGKQPIHGYRLWIMHVSSSSF